MLADVLLKPLPLILEKVGWVGEGGVSEGGREEREGGEGGWVGQVIHTNWI